MKSWLAAFGLALALSSPALGESVRVDFSGTVVDIDLGDEPGDLASDVTTSVSIGAPFAGYFTFDDSAPPYESTEFEVRYAFIAPPWTLQATLGDYAIEPSASEFNPIPPPAELYQISISDSDGIFDDGVTVSGFGRSSSGAGAGTWDALHTQIDLYATSDLLSSTALAGVPWNLSLYHTAQVRWFFERNGEIVEVYGTISVPEPASGLFAGLALLGCAALGFRRARS